MGMKINAHLPIPADLKAEYPLSSQILKLKEKRDREIREIFEGKSDKFLVIVGPCSADNEDSVCEYVSKLATINEKVSDRLMIIPRIYTNKPRTTGEGYKGMPVSYTHLDVYKRQVFARRTGGAGGRAV